MKVNGISKILATKAIEKTASNKSQEEYNTYKNYQSAKKDSVALSRRAKEGNRVFLDKGTAVETTLYVDYATFRQIAGYTTNNPNYAWSEMGIDNEKRWIVVNGQRFECPLSEEEKKARKPHTLLDALAAYETEREKYSRKTETKNPIVLSFHDQNITLSSQIENTKISNLLKNEKVMNILRKISTFHGGKISLTTTA